jgi:hypothetical protein
MKQLKPRTQKKILPINALTDEPEQPRLKFVEGTLVLRTYFIKGKS